MLAMPTARTVSLCARCIALCSNSHAGGVSTVDVSGGCSADG